MSEETRKKLAAKMFGELENLLSELYSRWLDEHEHEDFSEYGEALKPVVEAYAGAKFVEMHKRPFGVTFTLANCTYRFKVTTNEYSYKRIA